MGWLELSLEALTPLAAINGRRRSKMSVFDNFNQNEREYKLAGGLYDSGFVRFSSNEIQSVGPMYDGTMVTLKSGKTYILKGRNYGV